MLKSQSNEKTFFEMCLSANEEIGYVEHIFPSLALVSGLPNAFYSELVVFENGSLGQVISLGREFVEVMLFSNENLPVKSRVARSNSQTSFPIGNELFGKNIDPLGTNVITKERRAVDNYKFNFSLREVVYKPFTTGVSIVDLSVPIGVGQRELIIGDQKTGKTAFLMQSLLTAYKNGFVCIYCSIGQKIYEVKMVEKFILDNKLSSSVVLISSLATDPSGLIYLTPYSAMTLAEYFRDQGKDVFLIIDDLTKHAKSYRELSLLAKRFPGRNSYPGDIFYIHSKLIERAGAFKTGSITSFIVAESVMGDFSGYIQTNLMSITDGHIFFDSDYFNQGRRPAVNPFLSVTRVGEQAQTPLVREIGRTLNQFLIHYQKLTDLTHFGAELDGKTLSEIEFGKKLLLFFQQEQDVVIDLPLSVFIFSLLWAQVFKEIAVTSLPARFKKIMDLYNGQENFRKRINLLFTKNLNLAGYISEIKKDINLVNSI